MLQFALFVNGFGNGNFNGNFDGTTQQAVRDFQDFYKITKTGKVDIGTWMSLFLSSGDPNRPALGADCAMILNQAKAKTLYDNGYRYIGRYLTGTYGSDRISKALTVEEEQIILDAGLRFFPIYQDGGTRLDYFTESQGTKDGQTAIDAAVKLGIPKDTIIYFAVDFDAIESQVKSNIIPYFRAVYNELSQSIYRVGIYAPRYVCNITVNPVITYDGDISNGNDIKIVADVYNTGSVPVNQFDVNIYDSSNNIIKSLVVDKSLEVGQNIQLACFDYVKDGIIDDQDKTAWQQWINKNKNDSDFNAFADLNGDGYVNAKDFAMFNRFKGKSKNDIYTNI